MTDVEQVEERGTRSEEREGGGGRGCCVPTDRLQRGFLVNREGWCQLSVLTSIVSPRSGYLNGVVMESAETEEAKDVLQKSVDQLVQFTVDHEYYASDYSAKSQPHAVNLLNTLHDSIVQNRRFAAERELAGSERDNATRARKILQTLAAATEKRMHRGMPSIYAYLLGKPTHYSSHEFRPASGIENIVRHFMSSVEQHWLQQASFPVAHCEKSRSWPKPGSFTAKEKDFSFRPAALERFPFYFYVAGTKRTQMSDSATWDWHVASADEPSLKRRVILDTGDGVLRGDHPCYRSGLDSRLVVRSKVIEDAGGDRAALLNHDGTPKLRADHYVRVLTQEPWYVPVVFAQYTQTPKDDAPIEQKGRYALNAMILFRPWRDPLRALSDWISEPDRYVGVPADRIWGCLHESFLDWSDHLQTLAAPHVSRNKDIWQPAPRYDTEVWRAK